MPIQDDLQFTMEEAAALLDVPLSATDEMLRSAYLKQVQEHPPDREPEMFERIRDAYEQLRDPAVRARRVLLGPDPSAPLTNLLTGVDSSRKFIGSELWLAVLKGTKS